MGMSSGHELSIFQLANETTHKKQYTNKHAYKEAYNEYKQTVVIVFLLTPDTKSRKNRTDYSDTLPCRQNAIFGQIYSPT